MTTAERITPAKPEADYRLDAYRFEWVQLGISLMLDRIHEDRGRIAADLTFYTEDAAGTKALALAPVRIENLMAPTWKRNIRQDLEARQPNTDWQAVIEQAVMLTVTRWRQGNPFIDLGQVEQRPQGRFLLDPYLEYGQPTVVFADGGTGKSVMMLAALATVATGLPLLGMTPAETGPALLLDWESDEYTHNERLAALLRPRGLTIGDMAHRVYYRREMASLPESAPTIRRFVAEHGIKVVGIDSIGFATMGEEGRAGVVQMYNALRSFGVTSWLNDHIGKGKDVNPGRPYGSIYTHDGARRTFRLDALSEPGAETTLLSVTNHKGNNTGLSQRIGLALRITTADDKSWLTAEYSTRNVLDSPELAAKGSTRDTLLALLRELNGRWVTAKDLHEDMLGLMPKDQAPSLDTVRKTLQRGRDSAKPVFASRGVGAGTEWALVDRHEEPYWAD